MILHDHYQGVAGRHVFYGGKLIIFGVSKGDDRGKAANLNGSAWSHTSPTPQSTSDCMQSIRGLLVDTFCNGGNWRFSVF